MKDNKQEQLFTELTLEEEAAVSGGFNCSSSVRGLRKNKIPLLQPLLSSFNRVIGKLFKRKSLNRIHPDFVRHCEQELAYCIGPMASLIIEEILEEQRLSSHYALMEAVAQQIPDVKKAMEFKQRLMDSLF